MGNPQKPRLLHDLRLTRTCLALPLGAVL